MSMKSLIYTAALLVPLIATPPLCAGEPTELLRLRDRYQERIEEELEPLRASFLRQLDSLEKRLGTTRKLEEALYIREQRTALALDANAPIAPEAATKSAEYGKLAEIYQNTALHASAPCARLT